MSFLTSEVDKHLKVKFSCFCLCSEAEKGLKVTVFLDVVVFPIYRRALGRARTATIDRKNNKKQEQLLLLSVCQLQKVKKAGKAITFKCLSTSEVNKCRKSAYF